MLATDEGGNKMTLVEALEILKAKGITRLGGMATETNIEQYIANARGCDEDAEKYPDQEWAQYHREHADAHYIVETGGHHIIATHYDTFDMAIYSDYESDDEMIAAFRQYEILRDAEAIAEEMLSKRPGELPKEAWVLIATSELRAAHKSAMEAFERDFPQVIG